MELADSRREKKGGSERRLQTRVVVAKPPKRVGPQIDLEVAYLVPVATGQWTGVQLVATGGGNELALLPIKGLLIGLFFPIFRTFLGDFTPDGLDSRSL